MSRKEPPKVMFIIISEGLEHQATIRIEQRGDAARVVDLDMTDTFQAQQIVELLHQVIGSARYWHWKHHRKLLRDDGSEYDRPGGIDNPF